MKIRTLGNGFEVDIQVHVNQPTDLLILAYDASRENTVYISRRYGSQVKMIGTKVFTLPFPIEPKKLKVKVLNFQTKDPIPFKIVKTRIKHNRYISKLHLLKKFLPFAKEFSANAGTYSLGMYRAKHDNLSIQVVDKIVDQEGKGKNTPAHIYHATGLIQVVKEDFDKLPVFTRLFILLHEFAHYSLHTFDEIECDLFAWKVCKQLGVSEYECFNSLFRVFDYIPAGSEKEKRIATLYKHIFKV